MSKSASASFVTPVILCGGSGSRLWPLSRLGFPKQFLVLTDDDSNQSLFQQAVTRINAIGNAQIKIGPSIVVTNEEHRFLASDQLRELKGIEATLLLEPVGRNTAPALTLAALQASANSSNNDKNWLTSADQILVIAPADQTVRHQTALVRALQDCVSVVADDTSKKTIAILGVTPTAPETGYGYILRNAGRGKNNEYSVAKFVEKPDIKTAQAYLEDGNYLWNSGMFVMYTSTWLSALAQFRPDIAKATGLAWQSITTEQLGEATFVRPDKSYFTSTASESIDYAVIEKCVAKSLDHTLDDMRTDTLNREDGFTLKMVELDAGWSDLGAWEAVWQVGNKDTDANVCVGDVFLSDVRNSLIHSTGRMVGAVGVNNLIVVETADAVLVANRSESQNVKHIFTQLDQKRREEKNLHRKVLRPWGWYDSIDQGDCFKVKRIMVKPGASLSLQMHHHRVEHWIVVKGVAEIQNGDQVLILKENQSTYIPQGQKHRLSNPGMTPLEIIEVQSGTYLGEDDIVRYDDIYGRK